MPNSNVEDWVGTDHALYWTDGEAIRQRLIDAQ